MELVIRIAIAVLVFVVVASRIAYCCVFHYNDIFRKTHYGDFR